jgi:hypothetical protein
MRTIINTHQTEPEHPYFYGLEIGIPTSHQRSFASGVPARYLKRRPENLGVDKLCRTSINQAAGMRHGHSSEAARQRHIHT